MSASTGDGGGEARQVAPPPTAASADPAQSAASSRGAGSTTGQDRVVGVRASDADRQAMVDWLAKAAGEGLITLEEFSTFSGDAYAARTRDELAAVGHRLEVQLPTPRPSTAASTVAAAAEIAVTPPAAPAVAAATRRRWVIGIMSGATRKGRWTAGRRTGAFAFWGSVVLDLRDAVLDGGDIEITAWAIMGGVDVIVPEGIPVETSGLVVMGGRTTRLADAPALPGAPTVTVRGYGLWGGVNVRTKRGKGRSVAGTDPRRRHDPRHGHRDDRLTTAREVLADLPVQPYLPPVLRTPPPPDPGAQDRGGATPLRTGDLVTIVFTDIVGSTRYADALGDQRWRAVLLDHNDLVRRTLARHGGTEVKTIGDGFLVTFPSARSAIHFATDLQSALATRRDTEPDAPLEVRIGVHAGEVERDGHDVIGRNVTIACRLCDVAAAGEVLASSVVADLADSASDLTFGPPREHRLAGIERPLAARTATRI